MGTPGSVVVRSSGAWGITPSGAVAVRNAAGECPTCCGGGGGGGGNGVCCRVYLGSNLGVAPSGSTLLTATTTHATSGDFGVIWGGATPSDICAPWTDKADSFAFTTASQNGSCPPVASRFRQTVVDPLFTFFGNHCGNVGAVSVFDHDNTGGRLVEVPHSEWFELNPGLSVAGRRPALFGSLFMPTVPTIQPWATGFNWGVDLTSGVCAVSATILNTRTQAEWDSQWRGQFGTGFTVAQRFAAASISASLSNGVPAVRLSGSIGYDITDNLTGARHYGHFVVSDLVVSVAGLVSCP